MSAEEAAEDLENRMRSALGSGAGGLSAHRRQIDNFISLIWQYYIAERGRQAERSCELKKGASGRMQLPPELVPVP